MQICVCFELKKEILKVSEIKIKIENCNNILNGEITLEKEKLNIKYGMNGTGKTTISKALLYKSQNDEEKLRELLPYSLDKGDTPFVSDLPFTNVMVFDESYVNSYLFKENSFLNNSFDVFLKSNECDKLAEEVTKKLADLHGVFQKLKLIELEDFLPKYTEVIHCSGGVISRRGGVGEFFKGNGFGFQKHNELDSYRKYYSDKTTNIIKWAKWRCDGINQIKGDTCPFCMSQMSENINSENKMITKVFKHSALSVANAVISYLEEAVKKDYISKESFHLISNHMDEEGKEDELFAELQNLAVETEYLHNKICKIKLFKPMNVTHEELENISTHLNEMMIDKGNISKFYCTDSIYSMVDEVNRKIENLKKQTGQLKGAFLKHSSKLNMLVEQKKEDINYFFQLAGFPYKFELKTVGENKAISYLTPIDDEKVEVREPNIHLSWGEKNAFSLVMFMFESLNRNADLIVLDDPITSFDENKKFAVIRRLFDNKEKSFKGCTVLMLTHNMQPLIDYVHTDIFKKLGLLTEVRADYIQNNAGTISEKSVTKGDLINTVTLTKEIACDSKKNMAVRIVNLRKYIELTTPDFAEKAEYQIISNLIHDRKIPIRMDKITLDKEYIERGMEFIKKYLGDYSYEEVLEQINVSNLYSLIEEGSEYDRIIATRLLFERHNPLLKIFRREHPAACKFLNETNHIENEYVFQLDPYKFFQIPSLYLNEMNKFIKKEKDSFEH